MAPSTVQISMQLRQLIYYNLDNNLHQNALFLAGRLQGVEPRNPDSLHLLGVCHLRLGQTREAYDHTKNFGYRGSHLGCSYVFAQACLTLERYTDGAAALERARPNWERRSTSWNQHSEATRRHLPDAAAVYCLLGKLLNANGDIKRAVDCYDEALKLNPFMWDAFEHLCDTGAKLNLSNIFKTGPEMLSLLSLNDGPQTQHEMQYSKQNAITHHHLGNNLHAAGSATGDPFNPIRTSGSVDLDLDKNNPFLRQGKAAGLFNSGEHSQETNHVDTPTSRVSQQDLPGLTVHDVEPPNAPVRKPRTLQGLGMEGFNAPKMRTALTRAKPTQSNESGDVLEIRRLPTNLPPTHKRTISGSVSQTSGTSNTDPNASNQRRSDRILNRFRPISGKLATTGSANTTALIKEGREVKKIKPTGTKGRSGNPSAVGRVVSGNRKPMEGGDNSIKNRPVHTPLDLEATTQKSDKGEREIQALGWLLDLLGKLGRGYFALSQFQCQEAIQILTSVTPQQRETPWVLSKIGRAYFEQTSYLEAEKTFARLKKIAPSRSNDMEIYSTVLWHLKNDTELAFLSYELVDTDRSSPQAWCTIGNSFSLQREHDQAIKCFKRATQLDPGFAYGYTLQGHEHMSNEEYDKAMLCYRKAISAENRHYNGWYGLGKVFEKQGQYVQAEKHFRIAAEINPTNSVLMVCIGVVQEKLKKPQVALYAYDKACALAPQSTLARFRRARTLISLQRNQEALRELLHLKDMTPDESNVHFLLGRLYKQLHDRPNAVKHYTIALNLDPKAAQHIKDAMEAMDDEDEDDDDDDQMS